MNGPVRLKGVSNGADSAGPGSAEDGPQHRGKDVRVLVGVDVSEPKTLTLEKFNLRTGFSFNLLAKSLSRLFAIQAVEEVPKAGPKAVTGRVSKVWDLVTSGEHWLPIYQHHMATHAQRWHGSCHLDRFFCCSAARHQRRARQHPRLMQLGNGAIHPRGEAKVVGVHDQTNHGLSVSTRNPRSGTW